MTRSGGAVLGSPIAHSLSPVLHQAAYDSLGLVDWSYRAIECGVDELVATLRALDAEELAGTSLTMPLKRAVMASLATAEDSAVLVGAANTVLFGDDEGQWRGANTDIPGMFRVLSTVDGLAGADGGAAAVLGAGASAGSALAALRAVGYRSAVVFARRPAAADDLRVIGERCGLTLEVRPWHEAAQGLASAGLVVVTTPAGAADELAAGLSAINGVLFDIVYAPWPTPLAQAWERAGGRVIGGLELLVEQAVEQVRLMTGQTPPAEPMRVAGYAALRARS
jgi:shikimate dehydrogenase